MTDPSEPKPGAPFELPLPSPDAPLVKPLGVLGRGWDDMGRLRVKGWADPVPEPMPRENLDVSDREIQEVADRYQRAKAEGDDATIARLFPDVLDELHASPSRAAPAPAIPPVNWTELEPALVAEWAEWGRAHPIVRRYGIAVRRGANGSAEALVQFRDEEPFHVNQDGTAVETAWNRAKGAPRAAAANLVRLAAEEIHRVRRSEVARA